MPANPKTRKRLRNFFWIAIGFNLAEYALLIFDFAQYEKLPSAHNAVDRAAMAFIVFMLLFPSIFLYLAQSLIKSYFPDKELQPWKRRSYIFLGIVQLLLGLYLACLGLWVLIYQVPHQPHKNFTAVHLLTSYSLVISWIAASLLNFTSAIVLWRTIRVIRRNFQTGLLETFESL